MPRANPRANRMIEGDCVRVMDNLEAGSVDMIFADPPYFLQLKSELRRPDGSLVDAVNEEWDKFDGFPCYDAFTRRWLTAARRVLKPDGTLWISGLYHNIFRIGAILQELEFWILNDIIWVKSNPMPNFLGRRFTNSHETLIWSARSRKSRYCFNYRAMKTLNDDSQMRSDWIFPLCAGIERLRDNKGEKLHPTQKPEALLWRIILASTRPGALVLDPFSGTGTTACVAKKLGRRFIGIEKDTAYLKASRRRLAKTKRLAEEDLLGTIEPRAEKRVPFGSLIEQGLLAPGDSLQSNCERFTARIAADSTIHSGHFSGSIHRVGAMLTGSAHCNGWNFWTLKARNGEKIALNALRTELRRRQNDSQNASPQKYSVSLPCLPGSTASRKF